MLKYLWLSLALMALLPSVGGAQSLGKFYIAQRSGEEMLYFIRPAEARLEQGEGVGKRLDYDFTLAPPSDSVRLLVTLREVGAKPLTLVGYTFASAEASYTSESAPTIIYQQPSKAGRALRLELFVPYRHWLEVMQSVEPPALTLKGKDGSAYVYRLSPKWGKRRELYRRLIETLPR